jgi:hypothetical protein
VRFTGLVVGIAALGAILYGRVAASVTAALPNISYIDRLALVHDITAGKLSGLAIPGYATSNIQVLAVASFANGYHALFLAGALFMLLATILTWRLVNPADTQPVSAPSPKRNRRTSGSISRTYPQPGCSSSDGSCQSREPSRHGFKDSVQKRSAS